MTRSTLIDQIKLLEQADDRLRFVLIMQWLQEAGIEAQLHEYAGGVNIIVRGGDGPKIGIGSHYDTVPLAPGANDNASALVVCVALARKLKQASLQHIGLEICFFDEEEKGLLGSLAYLKKFGLHDLIGFLNLEMVGMGNQFALWPLNHNSRGNLMESFEQVAKRKQIPTGRYDRIIMNTADHESFRRHGLKDSWTLTCIGPKDVEVAAHYYKAMEFEVDSQTLYEIISEAPLFEHYHQPSDTSEHLSESALQMTVDTIWETILQVDQEMGA